MHASPLPEDMLLEISAILDARLVASPPLHRTTFVSLSRVCRGWNYAANLHLYQRVTLSTMQHFDAFVWSLNNSSNGILVQFLDIRDLGSSSMVSLDAWFGAWAALSRLRQLTIAQCVFSEAALCGLLRTASETLEHLELAGVRWLVSSAEPSWPRISRLHTLILVDTQLRSGEILRCSLALKRLGMKKAKLRDDAWQGLTAPITHLTFGSYLSPSYQTSLILATSCSVTHLALTLGCTVSPESLVAALDSMRDNLESLSLLDPQCFSPNLAKTIATMSCLATLRISCRTSDALHDLLENLPRTLRVLWVHGLMTGQMLAKAFGGFLHRPFVICPELKVLRLTVQTRWENGWTEELLPRRCEELGLRLVVEVKEGDGFFTL